MKIKAIYLAGKNLKIFKEILQINKKNTDNPVSKHGKSFQ